MPELNQDAVIDESERNAYPVPDEPGFLPTAAEARQVPADFGLVPQEPTATLPPVYESPADLGLTPVGVAPAVEFEEPPAPEPIGLAPVPEMLPAPELTPIERTSGALMTIGGRLDTLAGQSDRLSERLAMLRARYGEATTDAERAELVTRMQPIASALEGAQQEQAQARGEAARLADQGQIELQAEQARLQGELQGAARQEIEATRRKAEAERVGAEERTQVARAKLSEDRAAYRRALEAEPKMRTGVVISEMLAESINAAVERRQPQFGPILARGRQEARDVYRDRAERALALVEFGDDEVARRAAVSAEIDAQQAAAELEIVTRAEESLARQLGQAAAPLEQARLSLQLDAARQEREAREAQAEQARIDANIKRDKAMSEVELTRAKIAGERADVAKTEAETAKLQRRGGGGGPGRTRPGLIAPNVVTFPDSDRPLVEFADTPAGRKEAGVVRGLVGAQAKALDRINNVIRLYEDADSRGLLESAGWDRSGEYASLDTELAFLRTDLALVKSGGLATTEGDDKWAGGLVPDSPAAWSSRRKALAELNAIRSTIENEARSQLSSKTRLDKATRERVIGASRPRSISRSDLAEREKGQALQDLVSPTTSTARKKVAVDQVEAGAREEAQDLGAEDDWLPLATARLASALDDQALNQDKDAAKAATEKLSRYEEFALERAEKELASIQRGKMSGVTAGRALTDEELAALERAQANVARARRAVSKQQVREMSPAARRVWAAYPGMADVIAEVEAEQVFQPNEGEAE